MWDGVYGTHGEKIITFRVFLGKPEGTSLYGRIKLKQILNEYDRRAWTTARNCIAHERDKW